MKRYKDISYTLARISPLREDENGDYGRYEDVIELFKVYIDAQRNNVTDEDIEMVIKYFGE